MSRIATLRTIAVLIALTFAVGGCLFSSSEETSYRGRYISPETLDVVQVGNTENDVIEILGEPTNRSSSGEGSEVWRWNYTKATTKKGAVFLIFASSAVTTESEAILITFKNGKVTQVKRTSI